MSRTLATVVIGGIMSATVLTLLLFPAAYALANRRSKAGDRPFAVQGGSHG